MNQAQVQARNYEGKIVWVGKTDTCGHCLLDIEGTLDGYNLPDGTPSLNWSAPAGDDAATIECPRERVGWRDICHEPIGSVFKLTCEHRLYEGAGFHCLEDAGHGSPLAGNPIPHSDLTILWDGEGNLV